MDGITDHIGQAQIAPYLLELADRGHRIHIVSAEKAGRDALTTHYRTLFADAGISWTRVAYANKPPLLATLLLLRRFQRAAGAVLRREGQHVIHARAYLPFEVAMRLKREFGTKLLLDFRDFWADVGIETKRFKFVFRALKRREPLYFAAADRVITLTQRAARVLNHWYPKALAGHLSRYVVIPCCADFDLFDPAKLDQTRVESLRTELELGDGPVLLYLGSINHDYLVSEMFMLFKEQLELYPDSKFLFLTNTAPEAVEEARAAIGIPHEALRFASADRAHVPEYIALADLSVMFIRPTLSKAGCSPTKLAELFASNVPVIANTGVGDLDDLLRYDENCSVIVQDFYPSSLSNAVRQVLTAAPADRARIRENSGALTLQEGVERYDAVYRQLGDEA